MKAVVISIYFLLFSAILAQKLYSQSAGFNNTFAILSINGGANAYYDLNANTTNTDFNNADLGTFVPGTNTLTLRGAEHNVYKCGASDLTSTRLMYRIYSTSGSGGAFSSINVPWTSGFNNGCGGQDQQWSLTGHNLNVLTGLAPGSYFLEVYSEASVTNCCGGMVYAGNGGANYKATFTVGGSPIVVTATTGNVGPTVYANLKTAFDAINVGTHTGSITINVTGDTYVINATASLNASGSGLASYSAILIQPNGGAARSISAGFSSGGSSTINLNGADNVTINGLNTGGNSLTISNTNTSNTSGTSTIRLIGGATNNLITNSSILGSFTGTVATNGGNIFFSTDGSTANGNDGNTISNCNIGPAGSNLPTKGIYMNGSTTTTAINNSGNTIINNNIYNFFGATVTSAGVYIGSGNTDNNINNNRFYQTAARGQTTSAQHSAVWIATTSGNNFQITGNTIGYAAAGGTGTYTFVGTTNSVFIPIYLSVGSTTATSVQGNTIAGIALSGSMSGTTNSAPFFGIFSSQGLTTIGDVTGNTIGSLSATGSITFTSSTTGSSHVYGIFIDGSSNCTTKNNSVGGITAVNSSTGSSNIYGLCCETASASTWTCIGNTIGGTVSNSISSSSSSTSTEIIGIQCRQAGVIASNNIVRNMRVSGGSTLGQSSSIIGIEVDAPLRNHTVQQNSVFNLTIPSGSPTSSTATGICFSSSTGTNLIERNIVYNLSAPGTTSKIYGIEASGGTATYQNNMVSLGNDASGTAITTAKAFCGIIVTGGTNNFFHNSVYVGGSNLSGANGTYAFRDNTASIRTISNNIFMNSRSNSGSGASASYAISVSSTTGLTINRNIYFVNGTGGVLGIIASIARTTLASMQTATGQDANSYFSNPQFINPTGVTPDLHLSTTVATLAEGNGSTTSVTNDLDGDTRNASTPDIGADEFDGIAIYTCSTFPELTAVTSNAIVCGGAAATLSITGAISGTGVTYQWQSASTQSGTFTNISGATGATYNVPASSVSNLWYLCKVTCVNGPLTATTSSVQVQVLACNYATTRNTGISYNSIMSNGSTYSSLSGADDGYTNSVSLTGTTFKYKGAAISGFVATTNGWMTFNTANTNSTSTNDLTSSATTNVLAPLWDDLVIKGADIANKDLSMRYQIVGTIGSGSADIIIEWAEMERFTYGDPNVNFQVVLHESDNSIDYNYGNFQLFNGATNGSTWSYSIGLNGPTPATNSTDQRIILQAENSNYLNATAQNSLGYSILCNSQIKFSPSISFSSGSAPTSGSFTASAFAPANNETAGAITLSVNGSPCASNCGNIYSSKNATSTNGITACTATTPGAADDDVFFKFTTSSITNYRIAVDPSADYNAVVQVLDASLNPVTCVNASGAGLSELITSLTLNASSLYYIRIYDAATDATNNGEFAICISEVTTTPVNDEPSGAIALTTGVSCSATSSILPDALFATATAGVTSCSAGTPGTADDDIWYSFTTNSISGTSYSITATGVSTYNAVLQLFSGTVGNLTSVNCVNSTGNGGVETINAGALSTNTTYYLRVYHSGTGAANGNVSICVVHTLPACLTSATTATNDYVWQGQNTDWNASSNWLIYNGPSSYSVANSAPSNVNVVIPGFTCFSNQPLVVSAPGTVSNLTLLSGSSLSLGSNNLEVTGNLLNQAGATLSLNSGSLHIHGNYTNNGIVIPGTGSLAFVGTSGNQTITDPNGETFTNMLVNKAADDVILASNLTITGSLNLTKGDIVLGANNLIMGGATLTGGDGNSYVKTTSIGVLSRNVVGTATTFPVGNSSYNPAMVTNTGTADIFTLRVIDNVTADGTGVGATTTEAVVKRTWMVNETTAGGSNVTLRLYWNGASEELPGFSLASAFIAHYIASAVMWDNIGVSGQGTGYFETNGITSFSPFAISSSTTFAPLPIELVSFQANCAGDDKINVTWTTASEHNTSHYVVEKSKDGINWSVLGQTAAAGNSTQLLNYEMIDSEKASGTTYYRLTQFDNDGVFDVFDPVIVNCNGTTSNNHIVTYPNPSSESFYVSLFTETMNGNGQLTITDASGRPVYEKSVNIQNGSNVFHIGDFNAAPGIYFIQVSNGTTTTDRVKHSLR